MGPVTRAGHDDDVTMTAVATQSDWNRTLLTPLRAPAWRAYLYFVLVSVLAIAGVVFIFFADSVQVCSCVGDLPQARPAAVTGAPSPCARGGDLSQLLTCTTDSKNSYASSGASSLRGTES